MSAKNKTLTIDPRNIKTRDYNMVAIINGATKGGAFKDRRKDANKKACRGRWDRE